MQTRLYDFDFLVGVKKMSEKHFVPPSETDAKASCVTSLWKNNSGKSVCKV